MLNSGKKISALRDKKNKYSNSLLSEKKILNEAKNHARLVENQNFCFTGVNLVKSTKKRPIKVGPMSVLTVSGICKSKTVLETAVTECTNHYWNRFAIICFRYKPIIEPSYFLTER
jgi:hypothetical protein